MNALEQKENIQSIDSGFQVNDSIICLSLLLVNVCLIDTSHLDKKQWVLIDAGVANSSDKIIKAAEKQFGSSTPPKAIILTHGHFDHIGSIKELCNHWDVQVYAHELELPYLTGQRDYPPPDPTVGGGLMSYISPMYPNEGIDLGNKVKPLPAGGSLPYMPEWRWLHTPGHTEGHISLFRDKDRLLISGDAFITVDQESALAVLTQEKEVNGPPAYFTINWKEAWNSVRKLEALKPRVVVSSHGQPLQGEKLAQELKRLAQNFDELAIPDKGKYV